MKKTVWQHVFPQPPERRLIFLCCCVLTTWLTKYVCIFLSLLVVSITGISRGCYHTVNIFPSSCAPPISQASSSRPQLGHIVSGVRMGHVDKRPRQRRRRLSLVHQRRVRGHHRRQPDVQWPSQDKHGKGKDGHQGQRNGLTGISWQRKLQPYLKGGTTHSLYDKRSQSGCLLRVRAEFDA